MTRLLVLGLLDQGPMSGYDIQQRIREADAERWGGVLVGSIYYALKKLEREGAVSLAAVEQTGHRERAVYQITERGRACLRELVVKSLRESSAVYPTSMYSGLSLLEKIPREEAVRALEEQRAQLDRELAALEAGEGSNQGREVPAISRLTIENMFAVIRLQRQFAEQILDTLRGEEG